MRDTASITPSLTGKSLTQYIMLYLISMGLVVCAFICRSLVHAFVGQDAPFLLFYMAIVASAWRGGLRAGLLATVTALTLHFYTQYTTYEIDSSYLLRLALFALEGVAICVMIYRLRVSREQAMHRLATNQERLQLALETAKISLYTNDHDLKYTWISRVHPTFGPSTIIGKRDDELLPEASVTELMSLKREVLATGERKQQYIRTTIHDEVFSFFVLVDPILTAKNKVTGVTVATMDVTEATRLKSALEDQRRLTDAILRTLPAIVYVFDVQQRKIRYVSPYSKDALGYTPDEIIAGGARFFADVVHPDNQSEVSGQLLTQTEYKHSAAVSIEYRMRHKNGEWLWFLGRHTILNHGHQGAPLEILGVAQEVTERKQVEIQLRESLEQVELAKEAANLGVYDYDMLTDSIEWDMRLRELWGVAPDEHINYQTFIDGVHPEDREIVQAAVNQGANPQGDGRYFAEYRVIHRTTDEIRWVSAVGKTHFEGEQPVRLIGVLQEITREKSLQTELETALAQFEHLADAMPQLVWTANDRAEVDYYNKRVNEFDRISQKGDGTWIYQAVLHPDDVEPTLSAWQYAVDHDEPYECEHRVRMKDGRYRWYISRAVSGTSPDGVKKWYGTATDIHELKQVQMSLRESEARFRNMADNAPMMVWVNEADGPCTYLSQSWYDFTGQTPETGLGFGWLAATHPEDRQRAQQVIADANQRREAFTIDYRLRRADGEYRWVIISAHPRFTEDGEFAGYIGSVIDITERKMMEDALRVSEEKYRTLFDSIDEGFCICEMLVDESVKPVDYRFLETNPMFEPHAGLKDAVGKTALELVPNLEQHWIDIYGKVALTGEPVRFEQGSDVIGRWFDVYSFRLGDPEDRRFAILFTDITQRRQQEDMIRQQRTVLQQLVNSLPIMITIYEPDGTMLYLNDEFERLTGWNSETATQVDFMAEVYPDPEYRARVLAYMKSLESGWRDLQMTARDGTIITSSWANIRLADSRHVGIGIDIRERLQNEKRNQILRTVAASLSKALSPKEVTRISLEEAIAKSDAVAGTVALVSSDGEHLEIVGTYGYPEAIEDKWRIIPLDHPTEPIALAVREARELWLRSPEERSQIIPVTPNLSQDEEHQAWAVLPFNIDDHFKGVFGLGFDTPRHFDDPEKTFLSTLTYTCAQALARAYFSKELQEAAAIKERHRLAHDLHDAVKQLLFASSAMAESLPRMLERKPERSREIALEINRLNRAALSEMKILLQTMVPESLARTPFKTLLQDLCESLEDKSQINATLYWQGEHELYLPAEVHTTLYRLAQEAFNNIAKHSRASQVNVRCDWGDMRFDLEIHDDGQGFNLKRTSFGFGLHSMHERAASVGAAFNISSAPGEGTTVSVRWQGLRE